MTLVLIVEVYQDEVASYWVELYFAYILWKYFANTKLIISNHAIASVIPENMYKWTALICLKMEL